MTKMSREDILIEYHNAGKPLGAGAYPTWELITLTIWWEGDIGLSQPATISRSGPIRSFYWVVEVRRSGACFLLKPI